MALFIPLPRALYEPSARVVAPRLLGHWLIRNTPVGPCGGAIVETEAGHVLHSATQASPGERLRVQLHEGRLAATVDAVEPDQG